MQRLIKRSILALALLAAMVLCSGCTENKTGTSAFPVESTTPASLQTTNAQEITDSVSTETEAPAESTLPLPVNEDMTIETPYCAMSIPYAFSELVSVEENKTATAASYTFRAELENEPVPVYTIHFVPTASETEGNAFGTLKTDDGQIRVLFEAYEPDESLSEDDLESFYSAQETINDVFQSLRELPGFTPA